eukprot:TRINITY_DN4053_c0_g2_i2.p1 TRINITY_DN4053_c0_g2~~TRINITY_DN4053_c0_g2_i2.p1  ORF type:complete len:569 (-),score=150.51 TRINITY_DN4053_c0_g2_i2:40-1746(-)
MTKVVENYVLLEVIGSGQFGDVYKGKHITTDEVVAIKVLKLEKFSHTPKLQEMIINEIQTLKKIENPHIIKFLKMLKTAHNIYLVYEFCNGGTLEEYIEKKKRLPEVEALFVFGHLLKAFESLVQHNILHRDIKPSNILFHEGRIKVADFGFCKSLGNCDDLTETMVGSPIYMAPECLKGQRYSIKADIYSLGVVMFEMLFGRCPYEDVTIPSLIRQIDTVPLDVPLHLNAISQKTQYLLREMLVPDAKLRIDWDSLIKSGNQLVEEKLRGTPLERGKLNSISVDTQPQLVYSQRAEPSTSTPAQHSKEKNLATKPQAPPSVNINTGIPIPMNKQIPEDNTPFEVQFSSISKLILRERNKMIFINNLITNLNSVNLSSHTIIISFLLLKKMYLFSELLKYAIVSPDKNKYNTRFDNWDAFRGTKEFNTVLRIVNDEAEHVSKLYEHFREEMLGKPLFTGIPGVKQELDNPNVIEQRFLTSTFLRYAEHIKGKIMSKRRQGDNDPSNRESLLTLNQLLDTLALEEFFDLFVDDCRRLFRQPYHEYLNTCLLYTSPSPRDRQKSRMPSSA